MAIDPNNINFSDLEQQYKLPSGLLKSVMGVESGGNPNAVSPKGAQGIFQFMPETAKAYGINPLDPQQAAVGAARMYGDLSKQFGGDVPSMLAAYNWGSGNLTRKGIENAPPETRAYIDRVQKGMASPNKQYAQADTGIATDGVPALPEGFVLNNGLPVLPDGFVLSNDGSSSTAPSGNDKSYLQRVGEDIMNSANRGASILTEGTRNPLSAAIQVGGQAANMVSAPVSEIGVSAFRSLPDNLQNSIKSTAKMASNKIEGGIHGVADYLDTTAAGQAFGDYGAKHPALGENLQELSDDAKAAGNIAMVLSPSSTVKGKSVGAVAGGKIEDAGKAIYKSGEDAAARQSTKLASDLYTPKLTPKVLEERATNTVTSGVNQKPVYVPPAHEADAIKVLSELPIKKSNTLQKNYNIVGGAVTDEANSLAFLLKNTPIKYKPNVLQTRLDGALGQLKNDPLIIGDGEKVADRIFNKMKEISAKNPNTAHGLLKSRQQFDAWARSKKGSVFDANDTAFSTAVKTARNEANNFIADVAPNAAVKASLLRQSQLLDAMDNMATKIPSAPRTRIGMAADKVGKFIPDSYVGKAAGVTALGALGLAAPVATAALATGAGIGYGAYKLAASPTLRMATGKTIETAGKAAKYAPGPALFGDEPPESPLARFGAKFDRKVTNKGAAQ